LKKGTKSNQEGATVLSRGSENVRFHGICGVSFFDKEDTGGRKG